MTAPTSSPLPAGWSPNTDLFGDQWASLPEPIRTAALRWSVELLWKLSGRQFGTTEITLAPYIGLPHRGYYDHGRAGLLSSAPGGVRVGFGGGVSSGFGGGACSSQRAFHLPGPVVGVTEVVLDGQVMDETAWHLDPNGVLVRTDGDGWPVAQDVYVPRWVVRYTRGIPAPDDANQAAGRYALELARAGAADPKCKLPARVRDVTRQGISLSLAAPEELSNAGLTGIDQVDVWLRSVNPDHLAQGASIWTPTVARHRVIAVHPPAGS